VSNKENVNTTQSTRLHVRDTNTALCTHNSDTN